MAHRAQKERAIKEAQEQRRQEELDNEIRKELGRAGDSEEEDAEPRAPVKRAKNDKPHPKAMVRPKATPPQKAKELPVRGHVAQEDGDDDGLLAGLVASMMDENMEPAAAPFRPRLHLKPIRVEQLPRQAAQGEEEIDKQLEDIATRLASTAIERPDKKPYIGIAIPPPLNQIMYFEFKDDVTPSDLR